MGAAVARGGLGAAAGLLPIFVFLAVFALAFLVWLVASIWLLRRPPEARMSRTRALLYGGGSALVFAAALLAMVVGSGFVVAPLVLAFGAVTLAVPAVAGAVFTRRPGPPPAG